MKTVVCITITVIVTWLLGSLSLNIDKDVYHMFFTIFNALKVNFHLVFSVIFNINSHRIAGKYSLLARAI